MGLAVRSAQLPRTGASMARSRRLRDRRDEGAGQVVTQEGPQDSGPSACQGDDGLTCLRPAREDAPARSRSRSPKMAQQILRASYPWEETEHTGHVRQKKVCTVSDTKHFPTPTGADQPAKPEGSAYARTSSRPGQSTHVVRQPEEGAPFPHSPALPKRSYSAPLSYVGITRRISARIKRVGAAGPFAAWLAWTLGVVVILLGWVLVTVWYAVSLLLSMCSCSRTG